MSEARTYRRTDLIVGERRRARTPATNRNKPTVLRIHPRRQSMWQRFPIRQHGWIVLARGRKTERGEYPRATECLSSAPGRDGCPQPSVRRESCAPPTSFYSRFGQRRVGDNPPYPRHLHSPASLVGTAVLSRPFAERAAHLVSDSILSPTNGGLGTTRPTQDISIPLHR